MNTLQVADNKAKDLAESVIQKLSGHPDGHLNLFRVNPILIKQKKEYQGASAFKLWCLRFFADVYERFYELGAFENEVQDLLSQRIQVSWIEVEDVDTDEIWATLHCTLTPHDYRLANIIN